MIGTYRYVTVDYVIWLSEDELPSTHEDASGGTNEFPHWQYNTTAELKSTSSNALSFLLNGDGKYNGSNLWAQNANQNEGLPYLVNVKLD